MSEIAIAGQEVWVLVDVRPCDNFTNDAESLQEGYSPCATEDGCFGCEAEELSSEQPPWVMGVYDSPDSATLSLLTDLMGGELIAATAWRDVNGKLIGYCLWLELEPRPGRTEEIQRYHIQAETVEAFQCRP